MGLQSKIYSALSLAATGEAAVPAWVAALHDLPDMCTLLESSRTLHASGVCTTRRADHPMNNLVETHHHMRDSLPPEKDWNNAAIHGSPITPGHLLAQMEGASFCVSYFRKEQLDAVIPLLHATSILLLDNGAYSAWRAGLVLDDAYWAGYWRWALPILDAIPQAVAVIPDVIGGTQAQNRYLYTDGLPDEVFGRETQMMPVWHLSEGFEVLLDMMECGYTRIAFGSDGAFASVGTGLWRARIADAFDYIDGVVGDGLEGFARPRIHMMRGLGQMKFGEFPFDSADSTNIAQNHCFLRGTEVEAYRVLAMRRRIESAAFPPPKTRCWPGYSYQPAPYPAEPAPLRPAQRDLFTD